MAAQHGTLKGSTVENGPSFRHLRSHDARSFKVPGNKLLTSRPKLSCLGGLQTPPTKTSNTTPRCHPKYEISVVEKLWDYPVKCKRNRISQFSGAFSLLIIFHLVKESMVTVQHIFHLLLCFVISQGCRTPWTRTELRRRLTSHNEMSMRSSRRNRNNNNPGLCLSRKRREPIHNNHSGFL